MNSSVRKKSGTQVASHSLEQQSADTTANKQGSTGLSLKITKASLQQNYKQADSTEFKSSVEYTGGSKISHNNGSADVSNQTCLSHNKRVQSDSVSVIYHRQWIARSGKASTSSAQRPSKNCKSHNLNARYWGSAYWICCIMVFDKMTISWTSYLSLIFVNIAFAV